MASSVQALWRRRDLAVVLASSEFKSRYRRLGLGVIWAVLNPLVQSLLIALVFTVGLRGLSASVDVPFALFVLTGMMPWSFFAGALTGGTMSLTESGQIVQRVALPKAALPTASLMVAMANYAFVLATLLGIVAVWAFDRLDLVWTLPAVLVVHVALLYGMTLLTSSLQVRYRDVGQLVGAAVLAWFWVTPVIYPLSIVAEGHPLVASLIRANPMTGIVSGYRTALLDLPLDATAAWWSVGWAGFFVLAGWAVFRRREGTVADFL